MPNDIERYRAKVLAAHRPAFDLFHFVAGAVEPALRTQRVLDELPGMVLDMFMTQAHKAYAAVNILTQHGLMEDAATITRRLMELAVQSVYIGGEDDSRARRRKAGQYLAFMWRQLPREVKLRLPPAVRVQWTAVGRSYGRFVKKKAKTWGPNWRDMFHEIGALDAYESDYGFLAGIAHGRADNQVFVYSADRIRLHDHRFASIVLAYATRYHVMVVEQWNHQFSLIAPSAFEELKARAMKFEPTAPVTGQAV